jgi:hypothetical protein
MKKILFLSLLFFFCTKITSAQPSAAVTSKLKEVNNDTLKYIKESIVSQNQKYSGQPLEVLLKDLPHAVVSYGHSPSFRPADVVQGTSLYFYNYAEIQNRISKKMNPMIITIVWKERLKLSELEKDKMPLGLSLWDQSAINYFKNRIIESVNIVSYDF